MVYLLTYLIYVSCGITSYIVSIFIKYLLDHKWIRFRFDNWVLYLFLVESPLATTRVLLSSKKRPNIQTIKASIENLFKLDVNEKPNNNSYVFRISNHPTPMKITIIEPGKDTDFIITLESIGEDKLPKIFKSSLDKTVEYFEDIIDLLKEFNLKNVKVDIKINQIIPDKEKPVYNYNGNTVSSDIISITTKNMVRLSPLVKDCIRFWRSRFL